MFFFLFFQYGLGSFQNFVTFNSVAAAAAAALGLFLVVTALDD